MNLLQRLTASLRRQGFGVTLGKFRDAVVDRWFDFHYDVDTCACSELDSLTVAAGSKASGYRYQPARVTALRRLFGELAPAWPADRVLVDFGSGKGRVLLVAAEFGFREARGVEFARELCAISEANLARYRSRAKTAATFAIVEGDAAKYPVRADENVFVFCNPFDDTILKPVLDNIAASVKKNPRRIWILYYNPRWSRLLEERSDFARVRELEFSGLKFTVYSNER